MGTDTDDDQPFTIRICRAVFVSCGHFAALVGVLAPAVDRIGKIVEFDSARRLDCRSRPAPDEDRAPPPLDRNALARFDAGQIDPDRASSSHVG